MSRATANRDPRASHADETASYDGGRDKARWSAKNGPLKNRRADEFEDYSRRFNYAAFEDEGQEGSAGDSSPGTSGFGTGSC
jgi:hypothetical protein